MAPSPGQPTGVPSWVGPLLVALLVAGAGSVFGWGLGMTTSVGSKIEALTIQSAETKKVLEMLCTFMDEKKQLDRAQDDRLRQIELRLQLLGR